jgi:uncharacterized membrane protein YkgB
MNIIKEILTSFVYGASALLGVVMVFEGLGKLAQLANKHEDIVGAIGVVIMATFLGFILRCNSGTSTGGR